MKEKTVIISLSEIAGKQDFYSGKEEGKKVFQKLLEEVDANPTTAIFAISLKGIRRTDASFPRESVVSLVKMYCGEKAFYLRDFDSPDLLDNWRYAAIAKNQCIVVHFGPKEYEVIGPELSGSAKELLDFVMNEGVVTTSKVAKKFKITAQNASSRMKKLHTMGLVLGAKETAESGGLEYVYRAIR